MNYIKLLLRIIYL